LATRLQIDQQTRGLMRIERHLQIGCRISRSAPIDNRSLRA
jgi:hypothetical protein